jgi:hypothetical protein
LVVFYFVCAVFGNANHFVDHWISRMAQMEAGCPETLKVEKQVSLDEPNFRCTSEQNRREGERLSALVADAQRASAVATENRSYNGLLAATAKAAGLSVCPHRLAVDAQRSAKRYAGSDRRQARLSIVLESDPSEVRERPPTGYHCWHFLAALD